VYSTASESVVPDILPCSGQHLLHKEVAYPLLADGGLCLCNTFHRDLKCIMRVKCAYFVTIIDSVLCQCACDKQMLDGFQPSCLTGVRLSAVLALQAL